MGTKADKICTNKFPSYCMVNKVVCVKKHKYTNSKITCHAKLLSFLVQECLASNRTRKFASELGSV